VAHAIGHPEWATDPRLQGVAGRVANIDVWRGPLAEFMATTSTDEVVRRFVEHDVPCSGVTTLAGVASHPQVVANATLTEHERGPYGRLREPRPPVDFSATPARIGAVPPALGADTDTVLASLGYTADELTQLRAAGAIA
jgi:formyl-CoA transferase